MLRPNDSKSGTRSYTLENFRTVLLISQCTKTLCFSFEAFRAVKFIQQIASNLNSSYFKGSTFLYTLYTGCINKTEQICNSSQRREAAQTIKFMIDIDCLGTYDVE